MVNPRQSTAWARLSVAAGRRRATHQNRTPAALAPLIGERLDCHRWRVADGNEGIAKASRADHSPHLGSHHFVQLKVALNVNSKPT